MIDLYKLFYKTHFEFEDAWFNTSWDNCTKNEEYRNCHSVMYDCYYNQKVRNACPIPCERKEYRGVSGKAHGFEKAIQDHVTIMAFKFNTMDIEERNEVLIQDFPIFIGTVGGSLGLFIGFSFTCIFAKIIDYFIKVK